MEAASTSAAPPAATSASQASGPAAAKSAQAKKNTHPSPGSAQDPEAQKNSTEAPAASAKNNAPVVTSAGAPIPVQVPGNAPAVGAPAPAPKKASAPKLDLKAEPKPEPKPKAEPKVDPLALQTPAPQAAGEKLSLPAEGQWVGDVALEFLESSIIVRIATNGAVERVTWFNQTEPRKLAADLRGDWKKKGPHVVRFDTGPVKNVIVGEHQDRLRLAIQFRDGAVKPEIDPKVESSPSGVTLTIPLAVRLAR